MERQDIEVVLTKGDKHYAINFKNYIKTSVVRTAELFFSNWKSDNEEIYLPLLFDWLLEMVPDKLTPESALVVKELDLELEDEVQLITKWYEAMKPNLAQRVKRYKDMEPSSA